MASSSTFKRSNSKNRTSLLCNDSREATSVKTSLRGTSLREQMESLSLSERLARSVSQKLKNNNNKNDHGCLGLYIRGGGCRVGSCEEFDITGKGRLEDCMPLRGVLGVQKTGVECFSKKNSRKAKATEQCPSIRIDGLPLPDDVLELILVRLPLTSLIAARSVCRKWRFLITTPQFMQFRSKGSHQSPWLFLFGITKRDRCHSGEVRAFDVSREHWHRISDDALRGRFLFSVASIGMDLYVVGGCSNLVNSNSSLHNCSFETHKGVLVFSPLTGSWREASPMKEARSGPILGVFEVSSGCTIMHSRPDRQERPRLKSRVGGVSDVYEDPHRFSLRRQLTDAFNEMNNSSEPKIILSNGQVKNSQPKFALIAVGGHGSWDEPLDTGELYDPITNRWTEIARLPVDFGPVSSGAVCSGMFYVYSEVDKLAGYDLERGFWVAIQTSHPPPRLREYHPKLVSCRNRLFICCVSWCERDGQLNRREKAVRKLWEMDTVINSWTEVSRHPDAPMDWNAAFVADRDKIYGLEMFRIFGQPLDFLTACCVSETGLEWSRISRKHAGHEAGASSCTTKSMVVLHL